jgi:ubiquinone/menaquinone biosynthesis C-methylase UbiE
MSDESTASDRVRRYGRVLFDRAVGEADEMESARALCRILKPSYSPGMRVLDVGCGAGHYLRSFRERLDPDIEYTGIDASAHYIALARKAFPAEDRFLVGDAFDLRFDDRAFDIVVCVNVIPSLAPPPAAAIAELIRVAAGQVLIRALFSEINYVIRELDTPDGDWKSSCDNACYNNMYTEAYYREAVRDADPTLEVAIVPDDDWKPFDNRSSTAAWGTRAERGKQIGGNLILDWRWIRLSRERRSA